MHLKEGTGVGIVRMVENRHELDSVVECGESVKGMADNGEDVQSSCGCVKAVKQTPERAKKPC